MSNPLETPPNRQFIEGSGSLTTPNWPQACARASSKPRESARNEQKWISLGAAQRNSASDAQSMSLEFQSACERRGSCLALIMSQCSTNLGTMWGRYLNDIYRIDTPFLLEYRSPSHMRSSSCSAVAYLLTTPGLIFTFV